MFLVQRSWVLSSIVVFESAWVFSILGVVGLVSGIGGSPVNWTGVLLALALPILSEQLLSFSKFVPDVKNIIKAVVWSVFLYIIVGSQLSLFSNGFDSVWIVKLFVGSETSQYVVSAVETSTVILLLFWRGTRLSLDPNLVNGALISFRLGLIALSVAIAIDILHSSNIHTFEMIFLFFGGGLLGLFVGHFVPKSQESFSLGIWHGVIMVMSASVLVIGLVFGILPKVVSSEIWALLSRILGGIGELLLWALVMPMLLILNVFNYLVGLIFNSDSESAADFAQQMGGGGLQGGQQNPQESMPSYVEEAVSSSNGMDEGTELFSILNQALSIFFVMIVLIIMSVIVYKSFHRLSGWVRGARAEPESIDSNKNPVSDFTKLLFKLVPDWIKKRKKKSGPRLPDGPPGLVEPLRIYYRMIRLAENRGVVRDQHKTALEFQTDLWDIFPRSLVRMATEAFNRACYGSHSAEEQEIAQIKESINQTKRRESRI